MPLYSHEFQREVLYLLANNVVFATNYGSYLSEDSFDLAPMKAIFTLIHQHMMTYEVELEKKDLLVLIDDYVSDRGWGSESLKIFKEEVRDIYGSKPKSEEFVADRVIQFVRKQALKKAIDDSITILEKSDDYEDVLKLVDKAISIGTGLQETRTIDDLIHLPERYRQQYEPSKLVKIGISRFDNALQGGMAPGELHIFIGPPGCNLGNTLIPLLDGRTVEICQLVNEKEFWVYSHNPKGMIVPGRGHSAREVKKVSKLVKITLDNGKEITTTLDHRHMMRDGTYKEAQYLKIGDSMMPLYRRYNDDKKWNGYELVVDNYTGQEVFTHILVARNIYGRYPKDKTHIHHKDRDIRNNAPSNLMYINRSQHYYLHLEDIRLGLSVMWADPDYHKKMVALLKERNIKNWRIQKYRDEQIARSKEAMTSLVLLDPEGYSQKMSERAKLNFIKNPELRQIKSQMMKDKWNDPEFASKHKEISYNVMKANWQNEEFLEIRKNSNKEKSEYLKEKWKDPEYREAQSKRVYSEEGRKKIGMTTSEAHKDPEYHRKIVVNRCRILLEALEEAGLEINKVNFEKERLRDTSRYNGIPNWDTYIYYLNEFNGFTDEHYAKINKLRAEAKNDSRRQKRQAVREDKLQANYNHKVISVEFLELDEPVPVYDITVDKYENYALAAGIFTHNSGKSTFGCNIGAYNLMVGKKVFHATLEIKSLDVMKHYALRLSGLTHTSFLTVDNATWAKKMEKVKRLEENNLFVAYWPEKTVNTLTIRAWIAQYRSSLKIHPDIIIVDYDDCLMPVGSQGKEDMYEEAGNIYSDLIKLAEYFKCFPGDMDIMSNGLRIPFSRLKKNDIIPVQCIQEGNLREVSAIALGQLGTANKLMRIQVDDGGIDVDYGEIIRCTLDHKIMLSDGTMVEAENIKVGDKLMAVCSYANYYKSMKTVISVELETLPEPIPVYCLHVPVVGNFALGSGVVVSNCPVVTFAQPRRDAWEKADRDEIIVMGDLAHSAKKAHKAYTVSSLNFKKGGDRGKIYIDKCRRGKSNVYIDMKRDLSKSYFGENHEAMYDDETETKSSNLSDE